MAQPTPQNPDERRVTSLIDKLLARAVEEGASDIHLEPTNDKIRIRFRIDGVLVERPSIPGSFASQTTNRLKIQAEMDIAERRVPQDGGFSMQLDRRTIHFRASTFPTQHGEKIVLRVLKDFQGLVNLSRLGMPPRMSAQLREVIDRPDGVVLVTGPTGSGKTTTLYTLLRALESSQVNIMTLEDPIEYNFNTITQGQANERVGFTFARGLRSILRQDPDIIMVGEMRDGETARIAFRAGLTGHMVMTSLHTNSAAETFVRLTDMGLERYVVASALRAVLAQRLLRRLCERCRAPAPVSAPLQAVGITELWKGQGCAFCSHTGYKGRVCVYELVVVDPLLSDRIKDPETTLSDFREELDRLNVIPLRQAGLALATRGVTSWDEVLRVT